MRLPRCLPMLALVTCVSLAHADPAVRVRYSAGVPQIELEGSYPNATYTVLRADAVGGAFEPITAANVLCLGACFGVDSRATPGATYAYRFDLVREGRLEQFGPYVVTISPLLAKRVGIAVTPNPARGAGQVQLFLAGTAADPAVTGEVALFDLQGRRLRTLYRGAVSRGVTSLAFDGRDASGAPLRAGLFFVRFESAVGAASARLVRTD